MELLDDEEIPRIELSEEETRYLKDRGFQKVERAPPGKPFLFLGPELDSATTGYDYPYPSSPPIGFSHKLHSGGYITNSHPNNDSLENILSWVEKAAAQGKSQEEFHVAAGERISVVVKDSVWNPFVELLMDKYN